MIRDLVVSVVLWTKGNTHIAAVANEVRLNLTNNILCAVYSSSASLFAISVTKSKSKPKSANRINVVARVCAVVNCPKSSGPNMRATRTKRIALANNLVQDEIRANVAFRLRMSMYPGTAHQGKAASADRF